MKDLPRDREQICVRLLAVADTIDASQHGIVEILDHLVHESHADDKLCVATGPIGAPCVFHVEDWHGFRACVVSCC